MSTPSKPTLRYTKAFARYLDENKLQRLSLNQLKRVMNIIYTEGRISSLHVSNHRLQGSPYENRLLLDLFRAEKNLVELTANVNPDQLLEEMARYSEF